MTIVEVEEIVEIGEIPPDQVSTILEKYLTFEQITIYFFQVHIPSIYVQRVIKGESYQKRIERVTLSETKSGEIFKKFMRLKK